MLYDCGMELVLESLPLILILCAGIFVQSAAGFAAGLTIVPGQRKLYAATHGLSAWLLNLP